MYLTSAQGLWFVENLVELEKNCKENDIAIAQLLENQTHNELKRKRIYWSGRGC